MSESEQLPLPSAPDENTIVEPKKVTRTRSKKTANELEGRDWQRHSISVWSDVRKTAEELRLKHPALFPIELVMRLIRCFTNASDKIVLDPFTGVGTTPIAAELLGKIGIGIDLSPVFTERAKKRQIAFDMGFDDDGNQKGKMFNGVPLPEAGGERKIYRDDARNVLNYVDPGEVDLIVTSPPYWDILLRNRSADQKDIRHYGEEDHDLGKISDYTEFIDSLQEVFANSFEALGPGKYCIVIVMDIRKKDQFFPLHIDVTQMMAKTGFVLDDMIIWDRRHEYNNMRPLGYPYKFRINKAHEFILIFQKPSVGG